MSPPAKLAGYAVVLLVTLVIGLGLGGAVGPIDVDDADHDGEAPAHGVGDHGGRE